MEEGYIDALDRLLDVYFPTLEEIEICLITLALCRTEGVQSEAAKLLGISQRAMSYKVHNKHWPHWRQWAGEEELPKNVVSLKKGTKDEERRRLFRSHTGLPGA
jgi:hypothetical protein